MQKPYKDNYILIKIYGPIILFDTIEKNFELILAKNISAIIKIHHLLANTHFCRRKNTSTEYVVHALINKTYTVWDQGKEASALMLDIIGVFDNMSQPRFIHNLRK